MVVVVVVVVAVVVDFVVINIPFGPQATMGHLLRPNRSPHTSNQSMSHLKVRRSALLECHLGQAGLPGGQRCGRRLEICQFWGAFFENSGRPKPQSFLMQQENKRFLPAIVRFSCDFLRQAGRFLTSSRRGEGQIRFALFQNKAPRRFPLGLLLGCGVEPASSACPASFGRARCRPTSTKLIRAKLVQMMLAMLKMRATS